MAKRTIRPRGTMKDSVKKAELTPDEAAAFLGVSKPTIHRWFNEGKLEGWRTSDAWNARVWIYAKSVASFIRDVQHREVPGALK